MQSQAMPQAIKPKTQPIKTKNYEILEVIEQFIVHGYIDNVRQRRMGYVRNVT